MHKELMDPTGVTETGESRLAPRLQNLDGVVIGLLWNKKHNGDKLLKRVADLLERQYKIKEVLFQSAAESGKPTPAPILDDLAARCDVVLTAAGD